MSTTIEQLANQEYKYGFVTDIESVHSEPERSGGEESPVAQRVTMFFTGGVLRSHLHRRSLASLGIKST
jgi:hypothetical protein